MRKQTIAYRKWINNSEVMGYRCLKCECQKYVDGFHGSVNSKYMLTLKIGENIIILSNKIIIGKAVETL